jgi:hypothetical protein
MAVGATGAVIMGSEDLMDTNSLMALIVRKVKAFKRVD